MPRFGYEDSFESPRSTADCSQAATEALATLGCNPTTGENGVVAGTLGMGWVIRLLGAVISPRGWFPIRLSVAVRDQGAHRELKLRVDENFGVGTLLGVEKKIRAHCDDMGGRLGRLLRTRLV